MLVRKLATDESFAPAASICLKAARSVRSLKSATDVDEHMDGMAASQSAQGRVEHRHLARNPSDSNGRRIASGNCYPAGIVIEHARSRTHDRGTFPQFIDRLRHTPRVKSNHRPEYLNSESGRGVDEDGTARRKSASGLVRLPTERISGCRSARTMMESSAGSDPDLSINAPLGRG